MATEAHGLAKLAPFGRQAVGAKYSGFSQGLLLDQGGYCRFFLCCRSSRSPSTALDEAHPLDERRGAATRTRDGALATALRAGMNGELRPKSAIKRDGLRGKETFRGRVQGVQGERERGKSLRVGVGVCGVVLRFLVCHHISRPRSRAPPRSPFAPPHGFPFARTERRHIPDDEPRHLAASVRAAASAGSARAESPASCRRSPRWRLWPHNRHAHHRGRWPCRRPSCTD